MKLEIELEVEIPRMPNYLRIKGTDKSIGVEQMSEDFARIFAEQWVEDFMRHYEKRKRTAKESESP